MERLSSAFARLLGTPAGKGSQRPQIAVDVEPTGDDADADEKPLPVSPQMIVEGLLFVGRPDGQPLTLAELAAPIRNVDVPEVEQIIAELNDAYLQDGAPYEIIADGGGRRMRLRSELAPVRVRVSGEQRQSQLSQAAVETLAVVAYRQPIAGKEVNRLRGARSDAILAQLVQRKLLRVDRPAEGGPGCYATTDRFQELLGIRSLADLPQGEDLADR